MPTTALLLSRYSNDDRHHIEKHIPKCPPPALLLFGSPDDDRDHTEIQKNSRWVQLLFEQRIKKKGKGVVIS